MPDFGYAGKILRVDLSGRKISTLDTSDYASRFLGGRGIAAKIFWDLTPPGIKAFDPQNCLIFITGPVAGFPRFAGCRWQMCGKSPQTDPETFSYANFGGSWGAWLKFAGYDGVAVTGKADRPVYLYIENDDKVEIRDASHLWGMTNQDTQDALHTELGNDARVLGIGPAAENLVYFALAQGADNALGGGGLISVMGSKKLKAVVIKADKKKVPAAADPERLQLLAKRVFENKEKNWEPYLIFGKYGRHTPCYGCLGGTTMCSRNTYQVDGRNYRSFCQATTVYLGPAIKYFEKGSAKGPVDESLTHHPDALKLSDESVQVNRLAARLCDNYGLDTMVIRPMIDWLDLCYKTGILSESETGLPLSKMGSPEFIETLVKKITYREGFGDILAQGTIRAAQFVGKDSDKFFNQVGVMTKTSETNDYDPRLMYAHAVVNATEPRKSIQILHSISLPLRRWVEWREKRPNAALTTDIFWKIAREYWGSAEAGDFTTYEGKALAAKMVQDYGYAKESLIFCDFMWPIYQVHTNDPEAGYATLEAQIVSAITGRNLDVEGLLKMGERVFNLQRMLLLRDGWGGKKGDTILDYFFEEPLQEVYWSSECLIPAKNGEVISRKGAKLDRAEFEKMRNEYYTLRGWDVETGYPTRAKLEELGLSDLADNKLVSEHVK
jgi:aldehyde:ferredoxin oxidoreductase